MAKGKSAMPKCHGAGRSEVLVVPLGPCVTWAKRLSGVTALLLSTWLLVERLHSPALPAAPAGPSLALSPDPPAERRLGGEALLEEAERVAVDTAGHGGHAGGRCSASHSNGGKHSMKGTLCFLLSCCLVCCMLDHWNVAVPVHWRLPISVVIFMTGMLVGVIFLRVLKSPEVLGAGADVFISGMQSASYLDPHAIFYVLLPPLLYESASSMSWHVLRKVMPSAVLMAVPGVALNAVLVGCWAHWALHIEGIGEMSWEASLLLASILSATDPVAVVAALHSLGAPKKLATLIEGESLLNDGSAVVFFGVFLDMVAQGAPDSTKQCPGIPPAGGCICLYFMRLALGGPILGAVIGAVLFIWIRWARTRESPVLEISIVLVSVYGAFFLAESLHTSGVLTVVTVGIFATAGVNTLMSHEGRHANHVVLAQIGYICNHIIFFSAGMISARFMWTATDCVTLYKSPKAWLELLLLYLVLHAARALVITLFAPALTRLGYGITWKEGAVLVWGGLRGAVGLAMGLMVEHQPYVDERISATVAFHVSGVVLLTLIVNGMTVDQVYNKLQPYPPNPFSMTYLRKSLNILEEECHKAILVRMRDDWFFQDIDFTSILACVPDFSQIEFNDAQVPKPGGIQTVKETLQSLEVGATRFKSDLRMRQSQCSTVPNASQERKNPWACLKGTSSSKFLDNLLEVANSGSGKDHVANVVNTGDQRFEYRTADCAHAHGLYVSARPLSLLSSSDDPPWQHSFSVGILAMEGTSIAVGLIAKEGDVSPAGCAPRAAKDEDLELGTSPNSVGLDCLTGSVRFSGPTGAGEVPADGSPSITTGSTVHVMAVRESNGRWRVSFVIGDSNGEPEVQCGFGPFTPDQLYPAVQFCACPELPQKTRSFSIPMISTVSCDFPAAAPATKGAVVYLSYEPQTATDEESLRQLFHVIFNMVTHQYHEMHEHGLIGNEALAWLTESVEGAEDCAEGGVNHPSAEDFSRLQEMIQGPESRDHFERLSRQLEDTQRTFMSVFEPAIVEYLALERCCAVSSFDRLPTSWSIFRRFDYHQTLVKVESLWAFVEAHEVVLRKYSALERYPELAKCLRVIVAEAKHDLQILAEIKPRRYWYGKHFLALRVLMTKKCETLGKFAREGWLARDDCAQLNKSLRDRIREVENYIPRLYHAQVRGGRSPCVDSPDLPTPLASVRGTTDLMLFKMMDQSEKKPVNPNNVVLPLCSTPTSCTASSVAYTIGSTAPVLTPPARRRRPEAALFGCSGSPHSTEFRMSLPGCNSPFSPHGGSPAGWSPPVQWDSAEHVAAVLPSSCSPKHMVATAARPLETLMRRVTTATVKAAVQASPHGL